MIKAIIFDFGGVILRTQSRESRHRWDRQLGLEPGAVEHTFFNSDRGRAAQRGETSEAEHWQWLGQHFELEEASAAQLQQDFWAGDRLDERLLALIGRLGERYHVALISNAMDDLRRSLHEDYGIADLFEVIVISSEFGIMKPDRAIYERCLQQLGVAADEAVFVDDFAVNIAGAEAVGMHAVHYTPDMESDDLERRLQQLGVVAKEDDDGSG